MAAGLMLKRAGYNNITILEKREDPGFFDPLREFTYRVSIQGMRVLDQVGVRQEVQEDGVASSETLRCVLKPNTAKPKYIELPFLRAASVDSTGKYIATLILRSQLNTLLYSKV